MQERDGRGMALGSSCCVCLLAEWKNQENQCPVLPVLTLVKDFVNRSSTASINLIQSVVQDQTDCSLPIVGAGHECADSVQRLVTGNPHQRLNLPAWPVRGGTVLTVSH
uniref:Uncharacterized protein n=1 Tax=Knipowitschia caucasica TaxID=637954 RepID=A0AAV2KSK9_KNICA